MSDRIDIQDGDEGRDEALQAAVDDCSDYIANRLAAYADKTGNTVQHYLIVMSQQGDDWALENAGEIEDFDAMADAFSEAVTYWFEQGLCTPEDDDEGLLFTATFDPEKVRPS